MYPVGSGTRHNRTPSAADSLERASLRIAKVPRKYMAACRPPRMSIVARATIFPSNFPPLRRSGDKRDDEI